MNSLKHITSYFLILILAVGCASTEVTRHTKMSEEKIARPTRIHVFPFAATPTDIPSWSAGAGRYVQPSAPQSSEEIDVGRNLGILVSKELVAKINEMGLSAVEVEADKPIVPQVNDILLVGYFEAIEEGSASKRLAFGFGSGTAEIKTVVEGYQMTNQGLRQLGSGEIQSKGSKTPGVILPLAVFAATSNPIGLIVMGSAKVVGEVSGRNTIEGSAKRTAEAIADRLQIRFREVGWIR